ncbi:hypothetical protein STEG23_030343, partial [Scotinomys teguina]
MACNDMMLSVKLGCMFCLSPEKTGHAEVVRVVYQPEHISFEELLKVFWENHDPTQGMRQGNDYGTQYRSAVYPTSDAQMEAALRSKEEYQKYISHAVLVVLVLVVLVVLVLVVLLLVVVVVVVLVVVVVVLVVLVVLVVVLV